MALAALLAGFVLLLGRALQVLSIGTANAVWTGHGAAGTVLAGALLPGNWEHRLQGDGWAGRWALHHPCLARCSPKRLPAS